MAATHWFTNRGKTLTVNGTRPTHAGIIKGAAVPAAIDTEAEVQDVATVSAFLALTGVDEPVSSAYARVAMSGTTAAQDDTNNRANIGAADLNFGTVGSDAAEAIIGIFYYVDGASDAVRDLVSVELFNASVTVNGAGYTHTIGDYARAT